MSGKLCQELYERQTESEIVYDHHGVLWYLLRLHVLCDKNKTCITCRHVTLFKPSHFVFHSGMQRTSVARLEQAKSTLQDALSALDVGTLTPGLKSATQIALQIIALASVSNPLTSSTGASSLSGL
jgi:hypothetical protein